MLQRSYPRVGNARAGDLDGGRRRLRAAVFFGAAICAAPTFSLAEPLGIDSFGLYAGASPGGEAEYRQVEGVLNVTTPLGWGGEDLRLALQFQAGAGAVWAAGDTAIVGGVGPRFQLSHAALPLWIELGSRAGAITKHHFADDDLGGPFQFTSHVAIGVELRRLRFGARIQHTSNAGIYQENPGYEILGAFLEYGF